MIAEHISERSNDEQWPGVALAYEYVQPSYEFMAHRREVIEGRVRAFLTLGVTILFAAPLLYRAAVPGANLAAPWLLGAVACALLAVATGVAAQVGGTVMALSPAAMYKTMLHLGDWEFKQAVLYHAAEHFEINAQRVNRKGHLADATGVLLLGEAAFLIAWTLNLPQWS